MIAKREKQKIEEMGKASSKQIPIAPAKVRRVLDQIRGRSYEEALAILGRMPYRACEPISTVLGSAAANAQFRTGASRDVLFITEAIANASPTMNRFRPRAKGRGFPILKRSSQIKIVVQAAESMDQNYSYIKKGSLET